jgi:formate hydrogenlyase transcriptional activator
VDVRCIAATNRPLEALVEEGRFRSDLYYRLNIFPIELPALRHRREDLRPLVEHLLARHARRLNRRPPRVPEAGLRALEAHPWPGNVRELENLLERALILSPGDVLTFPDLDPSTPPALPAGPTPLAEVLPFDAAMRVLLEQALAASGGRIYGPQGAAARLGLKPTTLQGKLKRYGVATRDAG